MQDPYHDNIRTLGQPKRDATLPSLTATALKAWLTPAGSHVTKAEDMTPITHRQKIMIADELTPLDPHQREAIASRIDTHEHALPGVTNEDTYQLFLRAHLEHRGWLRTYPNNVEVQVARLRLAQLLQVAWQNMRGI